MLQVVNHDGLSGVVGCGIVASGGGHGAVAGVVVGPVALVELSMPLAGGGVAECRMDQTQVVMRGEVLGVDGQGAFEAGGRGSQELFLSSRIGALHLGPLERVCPIH